MLMRLPTPWLNRNGLVPSNALRITCGRRIHRQSSGRDELEYPRPEAGRRHLRRLTGVCAR